MFPRQNQEANSSQRNIAGRWTGMNIWASTKGIFPKRALCCLEMFLLPGLDPCLGAGSGSRPLSFPVCLLVAQLLDCVLFIEAVRKTWRFDPHAEQLFFHAQEIFFTLRGYKTVSHLIPPAWKERGKYTIAEKFGFCSEVFWSPKRVVT